MKSYCNLKMLLVLKLLILILLFIDCKDDPASAEDEGLIGTYSGIITGSPITGNLTLIVSGDPGSYKVDGIWTAQNGYVGDIPTLNNSSSGGSININYLYGLSMTGPMSVICPNGSGSPGCYETGATLGLFAGTISKTGGSGTWRANTGAAQTIGVVGSGIWSVTKQ